MHRTIHRIVLTTKNYLTHNINSAKVERPCVRKWGGGTRKYPPNGEGTFEAKK